MKVEKLSIKKVITSDPLFWEWLLKNQGIALSQATLSKDKGNKDADN